MANTIGVVRFPGSNCDVDCVQILEQVFKVRVELLWHQSPLPKDLAGIVLPGGFSYGDYLRGGALAAHSPILSEVKNFAERGGPVIGICNGFQVLTESHLLPGVLLTNNSQKFGCKDVGLATPENSNWLRNHSPTLKMPVAHGEGRYFIDDQGLATLRDQGQIAFEYTSLNGQEEANPNGSVANIAGISSKNGRILGMMPHPERACDPLLGSEDGMVIWKNFLALAL